MFKKAFMPSAFFTFISVILAAVFAAVEDHPAGYTPALGEPIVMCS
jgi:hypothetical protein